MTQLRSVTCHTGSHSVTCYPTQVNTPRLNPSHAGRYSIYLPRRDGRLSWPSWLDSAPAGATSALSITSPTPNRCTTKTTYYRSGTDLLRIAAYSCGRCFIFTHCVAAAWNDVRYTTQIRHGYDHSCGYPSHCDHSLQSTFRRPCTSRCPTRLVLYLDHTEFQSPARCSTWNRQFNEFGTAQWTLWNL